MVLEEDSELITEERIIALRDNVKKKIIIRSFIFFPSVTAMTT